VVAVSKVANKELHAQVAVSDRQHKKAVSDITLSLLQQKKRFRRSDHYNSSLSSHDISTKLSISCEAKRILETASDKLKLSARAYFKTIKVAQTIADMEISPIITGQHVSEALQYRLK
jgi:magnesium chelatase family protein